MVSTSGSPLLHEDAVETLIKAILPLTTILTPNLPEAKLLLEKMGFPYEDPRNIDDFVRYARCLQENGPKYVLLKGGHKPLNEQREVSPEKANHKVVVNILFGDGKATIIENQYLKSRNTHGTGCSLACMSSFFTC